MSYSFDFLNTRRFFSVNELTACLKIQENVVTEYTEVLSDLDRLIVENDRNTKSFEILREQLNYILKTTIPRHNNYYQGYGNKEENTEENKTKKRICKNEGNYILFMLKCIKRLKESISNRSMDIETALKNMNTPIPELLQSRINRYYDEILPEVCDKLDEFRGYFVEFFKAESSFINYKVGKLTPHKKIPENEDLQYPYYMLINTKYSIILQINLADGNTTRHFNKIMTGLGVPTSTPVQQTGVAYEVHNYFGSLDIIEIEDAMEEYVNKRAESGKRKRFKHKVNPIISYFIRGVKENEIDDFFSGVIDRLTPEQMFEVFTFFIDKSDNFKPDEKRKYMDKMKRLRFKYDIYLEEKDLIIKTIRFVCRTDDDFIENYIRIFLDECYNAYTLRAGNDPRTAMSCEKGVIERIVTTVGSVIQTLCVDEENQEKCGPEFKKLNSFFNLKLIDVIKKWSDEYLEGGPKEEELKGRTPEEVETHLREYIKNAYNNNISDLLQEDIEKELKKYRDMGVFQRLYFGGKHHINKRRTTKRLSKKNKTQKRRK